jgi:hypothetical protein
LAGTLNYPLSFNKSEVVENFPNKFTANYLFLINQTESSIPKVNKGSRDRYAELNKEWEPLKVEGTRLL